MIALMLVMFGMLSVAGYNLSQRNTRIELFIISSLIADIIEQARQEVSEAGTIHSSSLSESKRTTIADRESEYQRRHRDKKIDFNERIFDPFSPEAQELARQAQATGAGAPTIQQKTYKDLIEATQFDRDRALIMRQVQEKKQAEEYAGEAAKLAREAAAAAFGPASSATSILYLGEAQATAPSSSSSSKPRTTDRVNRSRWDEAGDAASATTAAGSMSDSSKSATDSIDMPAPPSSSSSSSFAGVNKWESTSTSTTSSTSSSAAWAATPVASSAAWGATPVAGSAKSGRSRWDETPMSGVVGVGGFGATPMSASGLMTPMGMGMGMGGVVKLSVEEQQLRRIQHDIDERNRPLTDEELDEIFPEGYEVLVPPRDYVPLRTPSRKLLSTPMAMDVGFQMPATPMASSLTEQAREAGVAILPPELEDIPLSKEDDLKFFGKLLEKVDEDQLSVTEAKERQIMTLLLKIKNGTPPQRKSALKQITEKALYFGPGPLFDCILPLFTSAELEDQERHLLVKVIDRILYKLDDKVRPHAKHILLVIQPMLIDQSRYASAEGREIISNLAKAAGLATMISTLRPDIDKPDEYVRNCTAHAFAVVATALGVHAILPFLKAVAGTKKTWEARHTGIKIVMLIAKLIGCSVLPHLTNLVASIQHGLKDEKESVRYITAMALSALAEASYPYGIDSFTGVVAPLLEGVTVNRGSTLAAFLKAIGQLATLMSPEHASFYTRKVMPIVIREFATTSEVMRKVILTVLKQCMQTQGLDVAFVRSDVLNPFFQHFWTRKMAMDTRNWKQVVLTTVDLANKVGGAEIINRIVLDLKDANEAFRRMTVETIEKIVTSLGVTDIDKTLEERMMDGLLFAYQEPGADDVIAKAVLNGFGIIFTALGRRAKAYVNQLCGVVRWNLDNRQPRVRQMCAELFSRVTNVIKLCGEEEALAHMGLIFFENRGEEFPEVLAAILGALKSIISALGMEDMRPPIKDMLPSLTPILKNKNERVQENVIDLVGRIADLGSDQVSPKEWMRICFDLLDLLKAPRKSIRRAAVNTFGYIAKAIGPQEVLVTLLNNLKVQDRTNRLCTSIAIAVVAEACQPFTVLPALMNEYLLPDNNVQNGVLKALSFLFEYVGVVGKDYVHSITPLLSDALIDRDLVHRQTACAVVKHMAMGVVGLGKEDAMIHLLNLIWPNMFESSPHVQTAVTEAIEAIRLCIGPTKLFLYLAQGLLHPARKVRTAYWRIYNTMYVACQDAMVASYPVFPDEGENTYRRWELEMIM